MKWKSTVLLSLTLCVACVSSFSTSDKNNTFVITTGNIKIEITKNVWGMTISEISSGKVMMTECKDGCKTPKLGFGRWDGVYLDLYQGYLFRLGHMEEWYEATHVISTRCNSDEAYVEVATNDPSNRTITAHFYDLQEKQISFEFSVHPSTTNNRIQWGFDKIKYERYLGFGERFDKLDQNYNKVGNWLEEGSFSVGKLFPYARVPAGGTSTYAPMPLYFAPVAGYGFQLNTFYRSEFNLENTDVTIMVETDRFDATVFVAGNTTENFLLMSEKNGRSLIPPPWAFGPWNQLNSEESGKNASMRGQEMLLKQDIPFSVNIDTVHFSPRHDIGQVSRLVQENKDLLYLGVPTLAYFNAMIDQKWNTAYQEASRMGYFTMNSTRESYEYVYMGASLFNVSQIDYTNPAAVDWYKKHLQTAIDIGYKGWMYDYGEYTPYDSINHLNQSGFEHHNEYPLLYQKTCFDFLTQNSSKDSKYAPDSLFYVRSGYLGSQKHTWAHWTGDPSSDWSGGSGLQAQFTAMLSVSLSGMPFTGSDIGGFEWYVEKPPSLELWARWTQLGTFSGLMHEQGGGKGLGKKTHIFDTPEGTRIWRKFAKLRMQLFPYIYTQAHVAHETGLPIMRHLDLVYSETTKIMQDESFMFGDSFFFVPILTEGQTFTGMRTPEVGYWIDISSNLTYDEGDGRFRIHASRIVCEGEEILMHVPLDSIFLVVKAGSIIPILDPSVQTLSTTPHPNVTGLYDVDVLHLWAWTDVNNHAYGDDWQGSQYRIDPSPTDNNNVLIQVTKGTTDYNTLIAQICFAGIGQPRNVTQVGGGTYERLQAWNDVANQKETNTWFYDNTKSVLWLSSKFANVTISVILS